MSKRIFSPKEQELLRSNPNVKRCSEKSITYATEFKERAVRQYEAGFTTIEIFKTAGFDLNLIGKKQPKGCLRRWRIQGCGDKRGTHRGARKKNERNTETDRLKWLEAEVKYLKAENAFLAQLRAKRAE
jgi:transposase